MAGLRRVLLLPVLALGCAADTGEEAAALMQQALFSTQASLAMAGGAQAPRGGSPVGVASPATVAAPAPVAPPGVATPTMPQAASIPAAIAPGPRRRGSAPPAAAAALMGRSAAQLRDMLGDPALRRAEGDAEIWLYEAPACRLDIVLYPQVGALVVAHAAARSHGAAQDMTEAACLSAIATAPSTLPWGDPGRRA
jgi:hypothetical protein